MPRGKDHHYEMQVTWTGAAAGGTTDYKTYSREYRADFPGKPSITGSSDPAFRGDPGLHNPEDMLVLALSSCHMLSYLALAALEGLEVVAYADNARGTMQQEGRGRSEEHTSELQSLMRISYAVFCLKKKTNHRHNT